MNKKLFSILFTLFLIGILSVSCSNKDKTGSGESTESEKGFGFDQTYAGTWKIEILEEPSSEQQFTINKDGSMTTSDKTTPASEIIKNSSTSYTITFISEFSGNGGIVHQKTTATIEFISTTSGNIKYNIVNTNPDGTIEELNLSGTLTRQ